jgi:hypothetical protein
MDACAAVDEEHITAYNRTAALFRFQVEIIMGGHWVEGNNVTAAKVKKRMVGTRRLELLTSTVSR